MTSEQQVEAALKSYEDVAGRRSFFCITQR